MDEPKAHDEDQDEQQDEAAVLAMKARIEQMSSEADLLRQMNQAATDAQAMDTQDPAAEDKEAVDSRSVYVGNVRNLFASRVAHPPQVDYASTPEELQVHFAPAGTINRVTILFDKFTGPKGYAYVEFADAAFVTEAVLLDGSTFRGRPLSVRSP